MPVVLVASIVFARPQLPGAGAGQTTSLLNWSAILGAGATFALPLCWGMPFSQLAKRTSTRRAAPWPAGAGAEKISRRRAMILTDSGPVPPGDHPASTA